MNKTLIVGVVALVVGVGAGFAFNGGVSDPAEALRGQPGGRMQESDFLVADDFVSARPGVAALPVESLSEEERVGLIAMREEEKLARDVYTTLYEAWGVRTFSNIAQSEQTHTEAVRDLLEKYDIADPVIDDSIGVFTDPQFTELYNTLTEQGGVSLAAALHVGALIEDLDIADLEELLDSTDNEDIALVYGNLVRGSRNHLRAFTRQLEREWETYTPEYISQELYDEIISTNQETGDGEHMGSGQMMGGGQGRMGGGRGWGNQ